MFGSKKRAYRTKVVQLLYLIAPPVEPSTMEIFKVHFKRNIDVFYNNGDPELNAALGLVVHFLTILEEQTAAGNYKQLKLFDDYKLWIATIAEVISSSDIADTFSNEGNALISKKLKSLKKLKVYDTQDSITYEVGIKNHLLLKKITDEAMAKMDAASRNE